MDYSSLSIFPLLLPHLSQMKERTNVLSKIYNVLEFLKFIYLLHLLQ